MKSALLVIAQQVFRDEEYAEPRRVLEERGARVVTASVEAGRCVGKLGMVVETELALRDAALEDWDAVAFIGGGGSSVFFDDETAHELARRIHAEDSVVGAICIAPSVLAHAGLLDGVRATAFPTQREDLLAHGAIWTGGPLTVDGRIITASGPEAAAAFGDALAQALSL